MTHPNSQAGQNSWLTSFLKELVSMPRRHIIVFFIAATLLVLLEVELTEGWLWFISWKAWCFSTSYGRPGGQKDPERTMGKISSKKSGG